MDDWQTDSEQEKYYRRMNEEIEYQDRKDMSNALLGLFFLVGLPVFFLLFILLLEGPSGLWEFLTGLYNAVAG